MTAAETEVTRRQQQQRDGTEQPPNDFITTAEEDPPPTSAIEETTNDNNRSNSDTPEYAQRSHLTGSEMWNLTFALLTWACTVSTSTVGTRCDAMR